MKGTGGGCKIIMGVKPQTTLRSLREYWAQHLEWQNRDIAIDANRLRYAIAST